MPKPQQRKRGRPKQQPMSASQLREQLKVNRERSATDKSKLDLSETEDTIALMMDEEELLRIRQCDIKELKRHAKVLWERLECEQWEAERKQSHIDDSHLSDEEFLDAPTVGGQMTRRQWLEEHKPTLPQRKNAKKPKSITDIKPEKYKELGLATSKQEQADLNAMEKALETQMIEQAIKDKQEQRRFAPPLGKRLRGGQQLPPRPERKSYWI